MQVLSTLATLALAAVGSCQSITKVNDFSGTPTNLGMYVYVPTSLQTPAPIIVAVHHCQGSAQGYSTESKYLSLADQHNFIVIYPNSRSSGGCFDVSSDASLKHDGGGDSQTIANMVKYAVENYGGDANRTFVTGTSSGAMMTNVLVGAYPDVFKAGSAYSGVPDGCFAVPGSTATQDPPGWNNECANGQSTKTAEQWGDLVRSYYPDYTGPRPRMQIWHGSADTTLRYPNYAETMKQWANVLGLTESTDTANAPQSGYTRTIYGEGDENTAQLVGYSAQGVGHSVPIHETNDLAFFGIA
ncbi:carbohydrate esterase family 1 protein [Annulohypoxylon truncatum]|uniref:carbohydrate esterase family 1 protein n=1 Tax=Annulohypoxylon truncatum TaxID=327061 RepID=UPI00200850DF|nr:carbohydrate esterase family 1 protein [Annulohypoxylon truncatum]KAI1212045.1 carbohydrate esterase family 1 protein [Annulohypoxylon truncatum]